MDLKEMVDKHYVWKLKIYNQIAHVNFMHRYALNQRNKFIAQRRNHQTSNDMLWNLKF